MNKNNIPNLSKYLISMYGPAEWSNNGNRIQYDTNDFGQGIVQVYKVLEGTLPSTNTIRHLVEVGTFQLREQNKKTLVEFMEEIKEGITEITNSDR